MKTEIVKASDIRRGDKYKVGNRWRKATYVWIKTQDVQIGSATKTVSYDPNFMIVRQIGYQSATAKGE